MVIDHADFEAIIAAPPAIRDEARRRRACESRLTDAALRARLTGTEEWNELARTDFIQLVLKSGVDTSTQELVQPSSEMPVSPGDRSLDDEESP